jgi:hypothetical protein
MLGIFHVPDSCLSQVWYRSDEEQRQEEQRREPGKYKLLMFYKRSKIESSFKTQSLMYYFLSSIEWYSSPERGRFRVCPSVSFSVFCLLSVPWEPLIGFDWGTQRLEAGYFILEQKSASALYPSGYKQVGVSGYLIEAVLSSQLRTLEKHQLPGKQLHYKQSTLTSFPGGWMEL